MNEVLLVGALVTIGLAAGGAAGRYGLPRVTAYLLIGVAASPELLGDALDVRLGAWSDALTGIALGFIAYVIGGSITVGQIRRFGKALGLTIPGEATGAFIATTLGVGATLALIGVPLGEAGLLPVTLTMAAVAVPTAPAATMAVIHQYRARGPLTSMALGVVAADDAAGVLLFALVAALAVTGDLSSGLLHGGWDIAAALFFGAAAGAIVGWAAGRGTHDDSIPLVVAGLILILVGASEPLAFSPLLATMTLGFTARYTYGGTADVLFRGVEKAEDLAFVILFTLAGMHFTTRVFTEYLPLIVVSVACRGLGKYAGARLGARAGGAEPQVYRWLGLALWPQAGVAIGLVLTLAQEPAMRDAGTLLVNVVLGATIIHELFGPPLVRLALSRAGELGLRRQR